MNVKAIMCDVDGTLLCSQQIVSLYTIEMIKEVRKKGIIFGLCTGRDVKSVKNLLSTWGIEGLVDIIVGTGGAEIYDFSTDEFISNYPLNEKLISLIIDHYKDMDVNFAIPEDGILYSPKDDELIQRLSKDDRIPYEVVDFKEYLTCPKAKLIIVCKKEDMDKVVERSKTFHNDQFKSSSLKTASILYEYMDPRVTKTNGLISAMKVHNIDLKDVVTFGDADNDYDMTLNAGIGVVMANGSEKTKSVADYITDDNDHDGIGHYIHDYILK